MTEHIQATRRLPHNNLVWDRSCFFFITLYAFVLPWEESFILPGFTTGTKILGFLILGHFFASFITNRFRSRIFLRSFFPLLFLTWVLLSVFWSFWPEASTSRAVTYASNIAVSMAIVFHLYSVDRLNALIKSFAGGCLFSMILILLSWIYGHSGDYMFSRYTAASMDQNNLAIIFAIGGVFVCYLFQQSSDHSSAFIKYSAWLYLPLCVIAILLTGSRTGFISLLLLFVYLFYIIGFSAFKSFVLLSLVFFSLFYLVPKFIPEHLIDRTADVEQYRGEHALDSRMPIWEQGIEAWKTRPLVGYGTGTFPFLMQKTRLMRRAAAHNVFLSLLVEIGFIGLLLFIFIFIKVIFYLKSMPRHMAIFCFFICAIWLVGSITLSYEYSKLTWLLISIGLSDFHLKMS